MKIYTCTNHNGHYPVGVASVIIEETKEKAHEKLDKALIEAGLKPYDKDEYTLNEIEMKPQVIILNNGNY